MRWSTRTRAESFLHDGLEHLGLAATTQPLSGLLVTMADDSNSNAGGDGGLLGNLKKGWGATVEKTKEISAVAAEKTKQALEVTVAKTNEGLSKSREFIHDHTKPAEGEEATRAVEGEEEKPNLLASLGKKTGEIINSTKTVIHDVTKPKAEKEAEASAVPAADVDGDDDV